MTKLLCSDCGVIIDDNYKMICIGCNDIYCGACVPEKWQNIIDITDSNGVAHHDAFYCQYCDYEI